MKHVKHHVPGHIYIFDPALAKAVQHVLIHQLPLLRSGKFQHFLSRIGLPEFIEVKEYRTCLKIICGILHLHYFMGIFFSRRIKTVV